MRSGETKYIYAIRKNGQQVKEGEMLGVNHMIRALSQNFMLVIGPQTNNEAFDGYKIQQEKTKYGQYLYSFINNGNVKVLKQNVLVGFPIICKLQDNAFQLNEQDFKKFVIEMKTIINQDQYDQSSYSHFSQSQQQISSIDHRCRGRPKGNRIKRKESVSKSSQDEELDDSIKKSQEKRGRGRPKGAKNIKKQITASLEQTLNEQSIHELFVNLLQNKSLEQVNTKLNRLRDKDDRMVLIKKQEASGQQLIKRSRGRPKGVKNKPKLNNQQSQSEQTQQIQTLPKRKNNKNSTLGKCCNICLQKQLKKMFLDGKNIDISQLSNLTERLSTQNNICILEHIIQLGDTALLKQAMKRKDKYQSKFIISWDGRSRLQQQFYTVRTRRDFVYKNRREGINALIHDSNKQAQTNWWKRIGIERLVQAIPNNKFTIELYEILIENDVELKKQIYANIASLVRNGKQILASYVLEKVLKEQDNSLLYGYSKEHFECLNKKRNQMQFKKVAILKQFYTTNFCSPIHCATINSNIDLLTYILKHISDFNVGDSQNRKPIHYAAVLQNSKALQILVKHGADLKQMDKRKITPLMLAAKAGRMKNIKYIIDKVRDPNYLNFKGDDGLSALHYAVIESHTEQTILLLQDILIQKQIETKEGMTIFHIAAGKGNKELIKYFIDKGFNPDQPDHFRKTPLMIAVRNFQNDVFFLIFHQLARYFKRDYSYNTLLHYAAAYGNIEIVKFFLEIGISQTMNRKGLYPFEIAILKGHYGCAKLLQNWSLHYSHHLINRLSKNPRGTNEYYEIYEYLLQKKKYNVNFCNSTYYNYTCLHFICALSENEYNAIRKTETNEVNYNQYKEMQQKLISLLLKYGANAELQNEKGQKALKLCIDNENIIGIQLLMKQIPFDIQSTNKMNNYAYYLTNIACLGWKQMKFVYQKLIMTDQKIIKFQLKKKDLNGFQFLIYLIKKFTETVHSNFKKIYVKEKEKLLEDTKGLSNAQITKLAVMKAFQEYLKHEDYLIKVINYLVENGSDPKFVVSEPKMDEEYQNYKKWGIQHFLMKFPSLNLLKIFMKWIDTNFNLQNSEGRTPLHLFCLWNNEGSIFNNFSPSNASNDQLPIINYQQLYAFSGIKCLEYLLQNGLTSNVLDINRSTPLLYSAMRGQLNFIKLLRNFGSTINNINSLNQVPLIEIIHLKHKFTLEEFDNILSDQGLRVDYRDLNQRNALHHLVSIAKNFDNSPEVCKKLLNYGVNINSLDKFGRSPLFYCFIKIDEIQNAQDDSNDKVQILQTLLSNDNININIVDIYQKTPLHYACQKKFFFSILYLLEKNIQYDIVDYEGNTPLAICFKHKNLNQAAMLIKKGVKYGNVVQQGQIYSYVSYAIKKLTIGICFMLIDHGYPLEKALEESNSFKQILLKRYNKSTVKVNQ